MITGLLEQLAQIEKWQWRLWFYFRRSLLPLQSLIPTVFFCKTNQAEFSTEKISHDEPTLLKGLALFFLAVVQKNQCFSDKFLFN